MTLPELTLPAQLETKLAEGHPWVYRDQFPRNVDLASGTWVALRCGAWQGYALWDAESAIAARVYSTQQVPDRTWVRQRVVEAWQGREPLRAAGDTSAYRLLFGEGDGLPGITVDLYNDYAVLATYAASTETLVPWVVTALRGTLRDLRGIVRRTRDGETKIEQLWGEAPPADLVIEEHGLKLIANLYAGQKTGLFLDQRENRQTLAAWCAGKTLLNCFSYTGAFSLYAARSGAYSTESVDIAPAAAEDAARNFALNGMEGPQHTFVAEDCFAFLEAAAARGATYDVVLLDPPSFARSRRNQHAALRAYTRLNALALRCVAPGGLLASASCTAQVGPEAFRALLGAAAAQARCRLMLVHEAGHALDHPVPAHFPEGRYLKFVLARVMSRI